MYTDSVNTIHPKHVQSLNARDRSRIETRRRLLETGMDLFARQGVAATRASDVAAEAGVGEMIQRSQELRDAGSAPSRLRGALR